MTGEGRGRVLVVDDSEANRELLQQELEEAGFVVEVAQSGEAGLAKAREWQPECMVLDMRMPGMDGVETCRRLKADGQIAHIPVLFLTAHSADEALAVAALKTGGNDLLSKPYSSAVLAARVQSQVSICRAQARLRQMVMTDELTGVFSRRFLLESLKKHVKQVSRSGPPALACLMIDIDHFKEVNDRLGHIEGDKVLRWVAQAVQNTIRGSDVIARFGGEEFAVILPATGAEGALIVAEKVRAAVETGSRQEIPVTVSVGVSWYGTPHDIAEIKSINAEEVILDLIRRADRALYEAKHGGRNRVCAQPPSP